LSKICDIVNLYVEREAFKEQGMVNDIIEIDNLIGKALLSKDKVEIFWKNIQTIMIERLSG
jgi:hypothetical protein